MITTLPITSKPLENTPEHLSWEAWFMVDSKNPSEKTRKITPKSIFITPNFTNIQSCPDGQRLDERGNCIQVIVVNENDLVVNRLQELLASSSDANIEYDYDDNYDSRPLEDPVQINIPLNFGHTLEDGVDDYGSDDGSKDEYDDQSFRDQSLPPPINVLPLSSERPDYSYTTNPTTDINDQLKDTTTEDIPVTTIVPERESNKESLTPALLVDDDEIEKIPEKIADTKHNNDSIMNQKQGVVDNIKSELEAESFIFDIDETMTTTNVPLSSTINDDDSENTTIDETTTINSSENIEKTTIIPDEISRVETAIPINVSVQTHESTSDRRIIESLIEANIKINGNSHMNGADVDSPNNESYSKGTSSIVELKIESSTIPISDIELDSLPSEQNIAIADHRIQQSSSPTTENLVIITPQSKPKHSHNTHEYHNLKIKNEPQSDTILRESLMKHEQKETIMENIDTRNRFIYHHLGESSNLKPTDDKVYNVVLNEQQSHNNGYTTTERSTSTLPSHETAQIYYKQPSVVYNLRSELHPFNHHQIVRVNNRDYIDDRTRHHDSQPYRRHTEFPTDVLSATSSYNHNKTPELPAIQQQHHQLNSEPTIPSATTNSRKRMSSFSHHRENSKSPREGLFRELTLQDIYKVLGQNPNQHTNR